MKRLIFSLLFLAASTTMYLYAQANLSIQGVIKNSDGSAVNNGKYNLTFKLYTAETGGAPIWTEEQSQLQVTGGIYSAILGAVEPLNVPFNTAYFLGVSVEGNSELIPRFKLTSAPYALALIGNTNAFPSDGNVGIGTLTPDVPLHVSTTAAISSSTNGGMVVGPTNTFNLQLDASAVQARDNGAASHLVLNPLGGYVDIGTTANTGYVTRIDQNSLQTYNNGAASPLVLNPYGSNVQIGNGSGPLTAGIATFQTVIVNGSFFSTTGPHGYLVNSPTTPAGYNNNSSTPHDISVNASHGFRGLYFVAVSDERIKKDFHASRAENDLARLLRLQVTDYRHVDELKYGSNFRKGFLAQQVEEVFPEAVSKNTDVVPDIFAAPQTTRLSGSDMTFTLAKNHDLRIGDRVQFILEKGQKIYTVTSVETENSFTVSDWDVSAGEEIFIYGREVADFRQVDYDRIFTLNVSATQELARRLEQVEKENAALKQHNENLRLQNGFLRQGLDDVEARLSRLENNTQR